ncbi:MAG: glycosyltransferase family 4 protein [Bacillota bacterium]|nr:glycosyltransferase family 4 protein [Bacillota bacterium]
MIKVLNIISDSNIGGAGKCVLIFCENYDRTKIDLTVAVPQNSKLKPEIERRGVKVMEVPFISDISFSVKGVKALMKIIKEVRPDVVHTHASMAGRIAARLSGVKKIVYTLHCVYEPSAKMKSPAGKLLNKTVSKLFTTDIVAVAQAAKDNLTAVGINQNNIRVILNGITPLVPLSEDEKSFERKRFGINEGQKVVSIIARLEPVKGHKCFIDAAHIIHERGYDVKFIIAGTGTAEKNLHEYAAAKGNDVEFVGFIPDPEKLISVTDISANASYGTEATSISLLEGMSLGVPAVVSDYGGNPGVIKDGVNGYLFPTHDAKTMADKIELLLNNEEKYGEISKNALKIFKERFTADIYTKNIESVYLK